MFSLYWPKEICICSQIIFNATGALEPVRRGNEIKEGGFQRDSRELQCLFEIQKPLSTSDNCDTGLHLSGDSNNGTIGYCLLSRESPLVSTHAVGSHPVEKYVHVSETTGGNDAFRGFTVQPREATHTLWTPALCWFLSSETD